MRHFLRLLVLYLKHRLKTAAFWVSGGMLLLLFGGFALLSPEELPASAPIGLMVDPSDGALQAACAPLLESKALRFVYYPPEALPQMQRDVRAGVLHCAYRIGQNTVPPITVYENDGAFLTPVTDELVFAAWYETQLPQIALATAERLNLTDHAQILTEMRRLQTQSSPIEPALTLNAAVSKAQDGMTLAPLLYAVLIPLFLLCVLFSALLSRDGEQAVTALLRLGSPASASGLPAAAAALAQGLLFAALPALCELLLLLLRIDTGYSPTARLALIGLLALSATLLSPAAARLRLGQFPTLLMIALVWAVASVIFSGAILSPEVFGRFGALRYLSPPWYLLRLMAALS